MMKDPVDFKKITRLAAEQLKFRIMIEMNNWNADIEASDAVNLEHYLYDLEAKIEEITDYLIRDAKQWTRGSK